MMSISCWSGKSFTWESWTQKLAKVTSKKKHSLQHPHLIGTRYLYQIITYTRIGRCVAVHRPP